MENKIAAAKIFKVLKFFTIALRALIGCLA